VARTRLAFANHYDNDVLALPQVSVPSSKKPGAAEPNALPDLIRVGQGFCDSMPMLWQQIWMSLGNMTLTLLRQVDLTRQIGARKPAHDDSPFNLRSLTGREMSGTPRGTSTGRSRGAASAPLSCGRLRRPQLNGPSRALLSRRRRLNEKLTRRWPAQPFDSTPCLAASGRVQGMLDRPAFR